MATIEYVPSRTVSAFLRDEHFIRGIMGPVGSGKSVGCTVALYQLLRAFDAAGLPSRWAVVRNTYRELEDTTLNTWMEWLRPYGQWQQGKMTHLIQLNQRHEVMFRALDRPQDIGKLLSLEISGAWLNEVREIPRAVYDMIQTRIGRYPRRESYGEATPPFALLMDSNPMDDFHWYYKLAEEIRPPNAAFYRQPGGREPDAENIHHLPPDYYENITHGKDSAWIKVYVDGEYGFAVDGKPVWPSFKDTRHVVDCEHIPGRPIIVGLDFGLTPAATFWQQTPTGQWQCLSEIVTEDTAADTFAAIALAHATERYPEAAIQWWGDPAGTGRAQTDARTPFMVLKEQGIDARPALTPGGKPNDFDIRVRAITDKLTRLDMAGEPALVISPRCKYLRRAFAGGYKYRQLQVSGDERFHAEPDKNIYSHVAESAQYAMIGADQGLTAVGIPSRRKRPAVNQVARRAI